MSNIRQFIIKKLNIIVSVMLCVFVLMLTVFAAVYTHVAEETIVTAKTNGFSVSESSLSLPAGSTGVQVTVTNSNENYHDTRLFDLIVIPANAADAQYITADAGTEWKFGLRDNSGAGVADYSAYPTGARVFSGIACGDGDTNTQSVNIINSGDAAVAASVHAVPHSEHNYFVGSFFELKMSANEYYNSFDAENTAKKGKISGNTPVDTDGFVYPFIASDAYADVYITAPFTVDEEYVFNAPASLHLLTAAGNDIKLDAPLTVRHDYAGIFSLTTNGGRFDNTSNALTVDAPSAYYTVQTADYVNGNFDGNIVTSIASDKFIKQSSRLNRSDSAVVDAVKADALAYIEGCLKSAMYPGAATYYTAKAFTLPDAYRNYGISYEYSADGSVERGSGNTTAAVNVSVKYDGVQYGVYGHNYTVIGTAQSDEYAALTDILGAFIMKSQPQGEALTAATDKLSNGIDISRLTAGFLADTGLDLSGGVTLSFTSHELLFEVYAARRTVTVTTGDTTNTDSVSLTAPVRLSGVTLNSVSANGTFALTGSDNALYSDVTALTVRRSVYAAAGTGQLVLTPSGGDPITSETVISFSGCTIPERNTYIEAAMPQLYISSGNTSLSLLSIREGGTYLGQTTNLETSQLSATDASGTGGEHIDYRMYHVNDSTVAALAVLDTYIDNLAGTELEKAATRSKITDDIFGNTSVNTETTAFRSYLAALPAPVTGAFTVSGTYDGRSLLGGDNPYFSYANGMLSLNQNTLVVTDGTLMLVGGVGYTDAATVGENYKYYIIRRLYSPSSGYGGEQMELANSTFLSGFFAAKNWLTVSEIPLTPNDRSMKIQSIAFTVTGAETGSTYTKTLSFNIADYPFTGLTPAETTAGNSRAFFDIVWNGDTFRVVADDEYVPTENSSISVTATLTDGSNAMTENYFFVINGIYSYGSDTDANADEFDEIRDIRIYQRMLQVFGNHDGYLYSDDVKRFTGTFDCSSLTLAAEALDNPINTEYLITCGIISSAPAVPAAYDLTGIEYAVNTSSFIFDGLPVASLAPFASFVRSSATSLGMKNCGITTAMLTENGINPLYKLNQLTTVDLSYNEGITALGSGILYRTVTSLDLSNCALTSLDGIESLVDLGELDIDTNNVKSFFPLVGVSTLRKVWLGSNSTPADTDGYYGTHGRINLCNIVAMMHNGVTVYVTNKETADANVKHTRIYEKVPKGTSPETYDYYYEGEMTATPGIAANESADNILSNGGFLITLEQEYLAVVVNAYFNFSDFHVAATAYPAAITEMFPAHIYGSTPGYGTTPADSERYSVTVEDITVGNGSLRTYRFRITYAGTGTYRYNNAYQEVNGNNVNAATVWRELTFTVSLSSSTP